jgi:hypothetical protein
MRKAQIRMFESIAVMFVFFILLAFGFVFYSRMQEASFYSKLEEVKQLRIIELAERVKNLPELGCSSNAVLQQDCFDLIKIEKVNTLIAEYPAYYYDLVGYGNVSIEEVYPDTKTYQIYERQKQAENVSRTVFMPIALYNPLDKLTHFGVLVVRSYE